ncbi:uncharacterized protein BKA78DRAFT_377840, partial [Phyllosticta capitalensis]|uniref:uncharacterized protein n=1 Tax=Phyllosticta capitalensis TaxID=121624 RepID=UPI003131DE05
MGFLRRLSRTCDLTILRSRKQKSPPDPKFELDLKTDESEDDDRGPAQPSSTPVTKDPPKYKNCRSRFLGHQPIPVKMLPSQMAELDADVKVWDFAQHGEAQATEPLHLSTMTFLRITTLARHTSSSRVKAAAKELESHVFLRDYDSDTLVLADQNHINLWGFIHFHVEGQYRKLSHRLSWQGPLRTASDGKEYTNCELYHKLEGLREKYEWMDRQMAILPPGPGREHRLFAMDAIKQEHKMYRRDYKALFNHDVTPLRI